MKLYTWPDGMNHANDFAYYQFGWNYTCCSTSARAWLIVTG